MMTLKFNCNLWKCVTWIVSLFIYGSLGAIPLFIRPAADGSSTLSIAEGTPVSITIYTLSAIDSDGNGTISFVITNQSPRSNFQLTTSSLHLTAVLDYETDPRSYNLTMEARTTPTGQTNTTSMIVSITDINDEDPVFGGTFTVSIPEEQPVGTIVPVPYTVSDPDTGDVMTYSLTGSTFFQIDSSSGVISIGRVIDYDSLSTPVAPLTFTVVVKDSATPPHSATQLMTITVTNINDNTPIFTPAVYYATVDENTNAGVSVTQLTATDGDISDTVTISIQSGDDPSPKFTLATGVIQTTSTLIDYEALGGQNYMYSLVVIAVDSHASPKTGTATVFITVTNINEHSPTWTTFNPTSNPYTLDENVPAGTSVVTINATDLDSGPEGKLQYSIGSIASSGTGTTTGLFHLDATTGVLAVSTNTLDRDAATGGNEYFNITVRAEDQGASSHSVDRIIQISLNDINDNKPACSMGLITATVAENVPQGYSVLTVTATDDDATAPNNVVTYAISGGNGQNYFAISSSTGDVSVSNNLDYELASTYDIEITAVDSGTPTLSSTCIARISITDINDNTPTFAVPSITVSLLENEPVGYTVATALAIDRDDPASNNSLILYSFSLPSSEFAIGATSGVITTIALLDREAISSHILTVLATDQGTPKNTGTITYIVSVTDVNDNTPIIQGTYDTTIDENTPLNTLVFSVSATDADDFPNNIMSYSITSGNTNSDFFIDSVSGIILVRQPLDREMIAMYNLEITVVDSGTTSLSVSATATVTIGDVNDNYPVFSMSQYTFSVSEADPSGTSVASVVATDADAGLNAMINYTFAYFITGDSRHFSLDDTTGVVYTSASLDREVSDMYVFIARATDKGAVPLATTATVTITITDYNDNTPTFDKTTYAGYTTENLAIGTSITTVTVTDKDIGLNADVVLSIGTATTAGARANVYIGTDSTTFNIFVKQTIDRETDSSFLFDLIATDRGIPLLSSTATMNITVIDVNDNPPIFVPYFYSVEVAYNDDCQGTVATLTATDNDTGVNAEVRYSFTQNNYSNLFSLNGNTGDITFTASAADDIMYLLYISASDRGTPTLISVVDATVRIDNYNPNSFIINYYMNIACSTFSGYENTFLTQLTTLYQSTYVSPQAKKWCVSETSSATCIVRVYVIKDDTADELSELANQKAFLTIDEAFAVTSADSSGTPIATLTSSPWSVFNITRVEKYYTKPESEFTESWFESTTGIIVMSTVGAAALVAIVTGFSLACYYKYKKTSKSARKSSVPRKIYPTNTENGKSDLPRNDTNTNTHFIKNRHFDGRAIDPDTRRLYEYNTKSGDRSWIKTPEGEPNMNF